MSQVIERPELVIDKRDVLYQSRIIRDRIAKMLGDQSIEELLEQLNPEYSRDVKECLDILDIDYPVTAVGILGRVLENCLKDFCQKKITSKRMFSTNSSNLPIHTIRKKFWGNESTQSERIKLINQQEINQRGNNFKLKRKILKDEYYNLLDDIKNARNDAFHGCCERDYRVLAAKSYNLIERGLILLVYLAQEIS